jgi:thiamine monophosphate kinase
LFNKFKITKIGRIISGKDIFIKGINGNRKLLEIKGYQHFT